MAKNLYATSGIKPDIWLKPTEIWELEADSFSLSKSHRCGGDIISVKTSG